MNKKILKGILFIIPFLIININAEYILKIKNKSIEETLSKYAILEERFPKFETVSECESKIDSSIINNLNNNLGLNKNAQEWCNINVLNIAESNLQGLPESLQSLPNLTEIDASNNSISSINLTGLTNISKINLSNNNITFVPNFKSNITELNLSGNPLELSSFENISSGNFILTPESYTNKLSLSSPFCTGIDNGSVTITGTLKMYMCSEPVNEAEWLAFLSNRCGVTYSSLSDAEARTNYYNCYSKGLYDQHMPSPGITKLYDFRMYNNYLTNLNSFAYLNDSYRFFAYNNRLTDIAGLSLLSNVNYLYLQQNQITDISPLSKLKTATNIDLSNNNLKNTTGLDNLVSSGSLDLRNNSNLQDLNGIRNFGSGTVYLDNRHFTTKAAYNSTFCQKWNNGVTVSTNLYKYQFCGLSPEDESRKAVEWLEFLRDRCSVTYHDIDDAEARTGYYNCYSKGLYDNHMPPSGITKLHDMRIYNNYLTNLNSFADVTNSYRFFAYNNRLTDISGLAALDTVSYLYLQQNQIDDITPLRGITTATDINLSTNSLITTDGLQDLTSVGSLDLRTNNNLQDLSYLANLSSGTVYFDNRAYTIGVSPTSAFCTGSVIVSGPAKSSICQ